MSPPRPSRPTSLPARWYGQMSLQTPPLGCPAQSGHLDLRHRHQCCGNNELETYCAWASSAGALQSIQPQRLCRPRRRAEHRRPAAHSRHRDLYFGAAETEGLFSFQYGRIEAKIMLPESQGMWPAFWLLGNNIATDQLAGLRRSSTSWSTSTATTRRRRTGTGWLRLGAVIHPRNRPERRHSLSPVRLLRGWLAHLRHDLDQGPDPVLR